MGETPQGLSQEIIVYIEYFHIEIFIYFHINESSQCALGRKKFFKHFYIPCGFFCFLRIISTWSKMACQIKSFRIFQWQRFLFFFFKTTRAVFHYLPKIIFPVFASWEEFLVKDLKYFTLPSTCPEPAQSRMVSSNPSTVGAHLCCGWVISPPSNLRLLKRPACKPSRHKTRVQSVLPAPSTLSPQLPAISINSRTTSWQAVNDRSAPPATEINGENECRSFESAKMQRKISLPLQRERGRERVGEAWIVWSVAQTTGSLW